MDPLDAYSLSILVVDDNAQNVNLLERILRRAGYHNVRSTTSAREAVALGLSDPPDILLLDLHMPELSGLDILHELRSLDPFVFPYVVVLTADASRQAKSDMLSAGARDYITKPFDNAEVVLRIRNLSELRAMQKELQKNNQSLEEQVRARTAQLEEARLDALERLALAAEFRDDATGQHTRRVGQLAAAIAEALGLDGSEVELIARAAPLHDVGKIAVPDRVLLKPGPLDAEEIAIMRTHTTVGAKLLSSSRWPLLLTACDVALTHHERWDGSGYPNGLAGHNIPISGRIVALADFFDALSHERPYRGRMEQDVVLEMVRQQSGSHFDPEVVAAFMTLLPRLRDGVLVM